MEAYGEVGLKDWLDKGWRLLERGDRHPLTAIGTEDLNGSQIIVMVGPKNRFGAEYFQVFLDENGSESAIRQAIVGLYSRGPYPAHNWVEIICFSDEETHALSRRDGERAGSNICLDLLRRVAGVIPPGGHLMVEYDSPGQRETARALALGVPPAVTKLGYLMYLVGCGASFRDWYFAEGGSEGPRKLQGIKPLNGEHATRSGQELATMLLEFMAQPVNSKDADLLRSARDRAAHIMREIETGAQGSALA